MAIHIVPTCLILSFLLGGSLFCQDVDSPKGRVESSTDAEGRLHGNYKEFFGNGRIRIQAEYKHGELHGPYVENFESGIPRRIMSYKNGRLHGTRTTFAENGQVSNEATFLLGKCLYPKGKKEIKRTLKLIAKLPVTVPSPEETGIPFSPYDWDRQIKGLRRLNAYRYVCDAPYDVALSWGYAQKCSAAVELLTRVGRMEHEPARPDGVSDDLYRVGYQGTSASNLHQLRAGLATIVDGFIFDSDPTNIEMVGHRLWCLNPRMKFTAFASQGEYTAMYAHDNSRPAKERSDLVCYPARGYFPGSFMKSGAAWSVQFNPAKYPLRSGQIDVSVWEATASFGKGAPVAVKWAHKYDQWGMTWVVFRPKANVRTGKRFWVRVEGVSGEDGEGDLEYIVEFFNR
jgi:hypothetical protein